MSDVDPRTQAAAEAVVIDGDGFEKATLRVGRRRAEAALAAADAYDAANGYVRVSREPLDHLAELIHDADGFTCDDRARAGRQRCYELAEKILAALSGVPAHPKENS